MLTNRDINLINSIITCCEKIDEKTKNIKYEEFIINDDLIEIICFNLIQIGELAKKLSYEALKEYDKVPWKQIAGMRDKIAHGYDSIDINRIWETCSIDIKLLLNYCKQII